MVIVAFLVAVALLAVVVVRRRRRSDLAGLNSARPVFHTEPPSRRLRAASRDVL